MDIIKILNFGSCNIDIVYNLDHIVRGGETVSADSVKRFPGGKGLNQSIALAHAGANVYHAGCIGEDGDFLRELLQKNNVNTEFLQTVPEKTGHAVIQVEKSGENAIWVYHGANFEITPKMIHNVLSHFSAGDCILLQNEINCLDLIVESAHRKGMKIVLNPSPLNEIIKKTDFNKISVLILNKTEAQEISGMSSWENALEFLKNTYPNTEIVLTLGKDGSIYSFKGNTVLQNSYKVEAVDTTGAGDTFTGFFLSETVAGKPVRKALRTASAASALSVKIKGAASSIPTLSTVKNNINNLECNTGGYDFAPEQSEQVTEYIKKHLVNATLTELSRELNYSPSYTSRWIVKNMNISFTKLLHKERCTAAAEILRKSSLPVSQIVILVGYSNESFFRKIFRENYGKNPLKYRDEYKKTEKCL